MEVLKTTMHSIYCLYDVDSRDLVEQHEGVAGERTSSSVDFLSADPP